MTWSSRIVAYSRYIGLVCQLRLSRLAIVMVQLELRLPGGPSPLRRPPGPTMPGIRPASIPPGIRPASAPPDLKLRLRRMPKRLLRSVRYPNLWIPRRDLLLPRRQSALMQGYRSSARSVPGR